MKILISESQLSNLIEQNQNWEKEKQKYVTDYERRELQKVDNQVATQNKVGKVIKKLGPNLDADDYADIVSGLIDAIPGLGNLISGGIDIVHGVTYITRFFYANTIEEKAEMAVMGMITLGMAFIPVGGNAANMVARGEIKLLLRKTPYELRLLAKEMGLIKHPGFQLAKQPWKYPILIALAKIFRSKLDDVIGKVTNMLASIANNSKELKLILQNYIITIKDLNAIQVA